MLQLNIILESKSEFSKGVQAKSEKKANRKLFIKIIEIEPFINYVYSNTLRGNKTLSISLSKGSCLFE